MSAPDIIDALSRAVLLLAAHGDENVRQIAAGIDVWLAQPGDNVMGFDAALGLAPGWRSTWRRAQRDAALARVARRHFPALHGRACARAVCAAASRYASTGWVRDRRAGRRPDGLAGDLYDVLMLGDLPGDRTLRGLFATTQTDRAA